MRRLPHVLLALACAAALAGCDDVDPEQAEDGGDQGPRVEVAGTDELVWRPPQLTTSPGEVDIRLDCDADLGHELAIEGVQDGQPIATCDAAGTGSGSVELEAGTYTFFCAVPGHREDGMEGELVVQ